MIHRRQVEHLRVFQRAAHQFIVLYAMAVIGDRHHTSLLETSNRRQLLACNTNRDSTGNVDIHHGLAFDLVLNERNGGGAVNRGRGIGHAYHCGEASRRCRRRAGGDSLLSRLPRLAQVHVQVD